ncbi:MAG: hypothetical protein EZS28_006903 [Streblomastix strix]|uniref:Uncharacterized protein n=1 Tax=Streblomastix strix TaxID=222440 RepID=A0A5J4WRZ0_9EUKA|nr:MAG: hypothetical protein EZS28_006903 [Streblomastix strix]
MKSPTIPEVEPYFEKEIELSTVVIAAQIIRCETPALSARRRSSIFEETLTPDPSVCRWLLDIISEDEHMVKESVHFVLSENQLIRVVAYTFDVYESQMDDDAILLLKADKAELIDSYSKIDTDEKLDLKTNVADVIEKDDALLLLKDDKIELDSYVDLTSTQTIADQKQFGIISVSSISKQNKNYTTILLAGCGNMLVSSLVSQPQLQEVRNTASGKSKGYVFVTTDEMNTWMKDQENVTKLAIGDNLYIVDKYVLVYWRDGTGLRALETELPDISNFLTILGAHIGSGNAITDLSFSGNTQIPAKNSSFITTNCDESITGQKTFNTTIHSVRIMFKITIIILLFMLVVIQDNALLLLKADKTQLTYAYTKVETYNLLNNKADSGVFYTKGEDDALLLLKADKTQLVDTYTKSEDDALLLLDIDKTQLIDAYTKSDDDALQLLIADKTQLICAYSKGETNNLLNSQIDSGVSYSKGEDDALLSLKADKIQLINSYTNSEADILLSNKANQSTAFTKTETEYLVSQIDVGDVDLSVTGSSSFKSGADNTVVLLGAGGTKPISEFGSGIIDDSNYVNKPEQELQSIHGVLRRDEDEVSMSEDEDDYQTRAEIQYSFISRSDSQTIYGTKIFYAHFNATGIVKTSKDDVSVLLASGGDRLISSFGGIEDFTSSAFSGMNGAVIQYKLIRIGNLYIFSLLAAGGNYNMGTFNPDYLVQDDVAVITYIPFPNHTVDKGGYVIITHSNGLIACKSTTNTYIQCASATWFK